MKNIEIEDVLWWIVAILFLIILMSPLSGCSILRPATSIDPIKPGTELLVKTVLKTNWLMTVAIIGVGAGFFSFLNGNGKGLKIMSACFVVLSLVLAISQYAAWIAGIAMAGAVGLMIYTTVTRNRALTEIVKGGEEFRRDVNENSLIDTGLLPLIDKTFKNNHNFFQSPATKKLVKYIKENLK